MGALGSRRVLSVLVLLWLGGARARGDDFRPSSRLTPGEGLSHPTVGAIVEDADGFVWLGTLDGLNRFDGRRVRVLRHDPRDASSLPESHANPLLLDRSGVLWVGTYRGLARVDRGTFAATPAFPSVLGSRPVAGLAEGRDGSLYVSTAEAVYRADPTRQELRPVARRPAGVGEYRRLLVTRGGQLLAGSDHGLYRLDGGPEPARLGAEVPVLALVEDRAGDLWVGTERGLFLRAAGSESFTALRSDAEDPSTLPGDFVFQLLSGESHLFVGTSRGLARIALPRSGPVPASPVVERLSRGPVTALATDRTGALWVGEDPGVSRYDPAAPRFRTSRHDPRDPASLAGDRVFGLHEDAAGALWIGTDGAGLERLESDGRFSHFPKEPGKPGRLGHDVVRRVREGPPGTLWIGTAGGGLERLDVATGRFTAFRHDPSLPGSLVDDQVRDVLVDGDSVLVATLGGLDRLDPGTGRVTHVALETGDPAVRTPGGRGNRVRALHRSKDGTIWVGTATGLHRLEPGSTGTARAPGALGALNVFSIDSPRNGEIAVGTDRGLALLDPRTGSQRFFGRAEGLPNESVYAALEDAAGLLWVPTNNGLARLDPRSGRVRTFDARDGLAGDEFNGGAACLRSSGEIVLGGPRGLTYFRPEEIVDAPFAAPVVVTGIRSFERSLRAAGSEPLMLSHEDRFLDVSFAALDFRRPDRIEYAARLEGLEKSFVSTRGQDEVRYRGLPPGRYVFRVRASLHGVTSPAELALPITIQPPFWQTWWAYGILGVTLAGSVAGAIRVRTAAIQRRASVLEERVRTRTIELESTVRELRRSERAAQDAREEAVKANRAKAEFLANMSHEIRTPLNAVIGLTGLLLDSDLDPRQRDFAETIRSSGDTLLALVNDILDLSKIESGKLELEVIPFDLWDCVEGGLDLVSQSAAEKGLDLTLVVERGTPRIVSADPTRVRQVLVNLLTNAVKFTDVGSVAVQVAPVDASAVVLEVRDTGVGIPEDRRDRLFRSFSQVDPSTTRRFGGTGLGLAISSRLVQLMGGGIEMESQPGKGSTFRATLPVTTHPDPIGLSSFAGKRVAIVGRRTGASEALRAQLTAWGARADQVSSAAELDSTLASGARVDLVVAEQAGRTFRSDGGEAIPVVGLVPFGDAASLARAHTAFAATLGTPVKPTQLLEVVGSVLEGRPPKPRQERRRISADSTAIRRRKRILLVEDNSINQKVAREMLRQLGYSADVAASGVEAIDAVRRKSYELVFMDVQMPEMDGLTATRLIRQLELPRRPRIVAMTAGAMEGDRERCLEAGMDGYISKPVRIEEIQRAVSEPGAAPSTPGAPVLEVAVASPEAPVIDLKLFGALRKLGAATGGGLVAELVGTFLAQVPGRISALEADVASGSVSSLRLHAHTLKGSAGQLGAARLAQLCQELEAVADSGSLDGAMPLLGALGAEVAKVRAALEKELLEADPHGA